MRAHAGEWMQTFTGKAFYHHDFDLKDIDARDIAHALSLICRFGGHVRRFYSVAEHCVLMSHAVSPENALWALLHDAPEAYIGDMVRPLKRHPDMKLYCVTDDNIMAAICTKFGLGFDFPPEVKEADNRILLDERDALLSTPPQSWHQDGLESLGVRIGGWHPEVAEYSYLARLNELTGKDWSE